MSKATWLHLSDIHFCPKKTWRDAGSRSSLLNYLKENIKNGKAKTPNFIFCTGDIAFGNTATMPIKEQYEQAEEFFDKLIEICGTPTKPFQKENLFIVPGNHDVDRSVINADAQSSLQVWAKNPHKHTDIINQRFQERGNEFKDAIRRLDKYGDFISRYLPHQADPEGRHVFSAIREVNGLKFGISGFNSAWTCAGDEDDRNIWLAAQWQFGKAKEQISEADVKIGLIHHPEDWFNTADHETSTIEISESFDFWLHGHTHNAWVRPLSSHTVISAGAIGAEASEEFGFNIVDMDFSDGNGVVALHTKKKIGNWTIAPISTHAPLGQWTLKLARFAKLPNVETPQDTELLEKRSPLSILVERQLSKRLGDALKLFSSHENNWIEPILSKHSETEKGIDHDSHLNIRELACNPKDIIIKSPPQYGLTSLAHYLVLEAWKEAPEQLWLFLDIQTMKPNNSSIDAAIDDELQLTGFSTSDVACIVLDSFSINQKESVKIYNLIAKKFPNTPLICMQHQELKVDFTETSPLERNFESVFLWSLPREKVRSFVSAYNQHKTIGDEDTVTSKLIADMEVLNLHRTPLNCLTLLKVSEIDFDESPVNRSEMIKRVLFLLFNMDDIPTYKLRPDLKDCEYVLGYFCEKLIRNGEYNFSRESFLRQSQECCRDMLIDLETQVVFDVLHRNNIIVYKNNSFSFKFSYWVYYFAAQRMHHEAAFAEYMLSDMRYIRFPELIEFYTGIDRRREDALEVLIKDLSAVRIQTEERCGFPANLNPYKFGRWETTDKDQKLMQEEIANGVAESSLPDEIKDRYADRNYDRSRPHDQSIGRILTEHSFDQMMIGACAAARALRNCDYASLELKRKLLCEIILCWEQASKVMFVVLPILASQQHALYEGVQFVLSGNFGETEEQRFVNVLTHIPITITKAFEEDLFSMKMGPLLLNQIKSGQMSDISRHEVMLLVVRKRPRDWVRTVESYINNVGYNSFYLMDIYKALRVEYMYAFVSNSVLKDIEQLIKQVGVRHILNTKSPTEKKFNSIKWEEDFMPKRPT